MTELEELVSRYLSEGTPEAARALRACLRTIGIPHREAIEGVLLGSRPMRLSQIAQELGVPVSHIASTLARMVEDGSVVRVKRGTYAMVKHE